MIASGDNKKIIESLDTKEKLRKILTSKAREFIDYLLLHAILASFT